MSSAEVTGITTGNLGAAVRAGIVAGGQALAFQAVGDITLGPGHPQPDFMSPRYVANVLGHSLVGCGAAAVSGNNCGAGALSAAVPAAAGPFLVNLNTGGRLAASTVLGGVASVAGGGKFANGAVTGAFGYLYNACGGGPRGCAALFSAYGVFGGAVLVSGVAEVGTLGAATPVLPVPILVGGAIGGGFGWVAGWFADQLLNENTSDKGCVYCTENTPSGKPYVGRTDDMPRRENERSDGRDRRGAEIVDTYPKGNRNAGRAAEEKAINDRGGIDNLDNKRNEVAPRNWPKLGIDP